MSPPSFRVQLCDAPHLSEQQERYLTIAFAAALQADLPYPPQHCSQAYWRMLDSEPWDMDPDELAMGMAWMDVTDALSARLLDAGTRAYFEVTFE